MLQFMGSQLSDGTNYVLSISRVQLCDPMDCSFPGSSVHGDSPACPPCPPGDLPNPGIEPRSPTLQVDYLPSESLGKPSNWNKLK